MPTFDSARVALLESRMSGELASLVTHCGGQPVCVRAVREVLNPRGGVVAFLRGLTAGRFAAVVFLTGAGVSALMQETERLGQQTEARAALRRVTIACRGPKPVAALRQHSLNASITAAEPYTTTDLLAAMAGIDLQDRHVALVHYGERNHQVADALAARGARLEELELYQWQLPDDTGPLRTLVRDIIGGKLDAVVFTSQIQCRHLFQVAADLGLDDLLATALNLRVPVASIGPICTDALKSLGVTPRVTPGRPRMGALVQALADYMELTSPRHAETA